jgi:predicted transcriptional regulator
MNIMKKQVNSVKRLTRAEEEIMQALWIIGSGRMHNILAALSSKPARTTVSTLLTILENKGFVKHVVVGRQHIYTPTLSKSEYSKFQLQSLVKNYFNGSFASMVSFFAKETDIPLEQLDEIVNQSKKEKKQ